MMVANNNTPYNLRGVRVLVVEDFPFMAQLMSAMLRRFNIGTVLSTCSVSEAKKIIETQNVDSPSSQYIDMIITDLFPPRDEGLDLLSWVRGNKEETVCYTPILFCTAHATKDVVIKGRDLGTNEILVKPINAEKLAFRILHIIDNARQYIKSPTYFGPDRLRKAEIFTGAERRRTGTDHINFVSEE